MVANTVLGTRVEQGILVDGSPGIVLADNVVTAPDEEGIRVVSSAGALVHRNRVSKSHGSNGITVSRSAGASIVESMAVDSYRDGFRVMNSPGLVLTGNRAVANGNVGFRIESSPPFATEDDVLAQGNLATGNERRAIVVDAQALLLLTLRDQHDPADHDHDAAEHHVVPHYLGHTDHYHLDVDHTGATAGAGDLAILCPHRERFGGLFQHPRTAPFGRRAGERDDPRGSSRGLPDRRSCERRGDAGARRRHAGAARSRRRRLPAGAPRHLSELRRPSGIALGRAHWLVQGKPNAATPPTAPVPYPA